MGKKRKHAGAPTTAAGPASAPPAKAHKGNTAQASPHKAAGALQGHKKSDQAAPRRPAHQHTAVAPTGLGQQLAAAPGRLARGDLSSLSSSQPAAKWAPPPAAPSCCPRDPLAAVCMELERADALGLLRTKFVSLAAKAGLRNAPLLALERWRFAAKWAEDEPQMAAAAAAAAAAADPDADAGTEQQQQQGSKQSSRAQQASNQQKKAPKQQPGDPVVPFGSLPVAPEPGLVTDLMRAGVDAAAAVDVATQLARAAAQAAAGLVKKKQQLASGKEATCRDVIVTVHKHSLDLTCGGQFVKISRAAYGKLARLYRQHWIGRVAANSSAAAAAAAATAAAAADGGGGGSNARAGAAASAAAGFTVGLPPADAAAMLAKLQRAVARLTAQLDDSNEGAGKGQRAEAAAGSESEDSEGDTGSEHPVSSNPNRAAAAAAAAAAAGGGGGGGGSTPQAPASGRSQQPEQPTNSSTAGYASLLDAEASLAELEAQQPAWADVARKDITGSSSSSGRGEFHARLFALLLRYKSIQGHGFQAAAGPPVFDLLRQQLCVGFECFASPLNAHFAQFGSVFPDVDAPFGSSGSFFRMKLKHGSYEVNPPFVPAILTASAQHMLQQLQDAEAAGGALGFVVLMPGWREVPGWRLLHGSCFLKQSLLVAAADHGYSDGASHQRKDLYRQSPYDSSVFFLQTSTAARKWPVKQRLLQDLQVAFAACCPSTAAVERQKKQRGAKDLEAQGYA